MATAVVKLDFRKTERGRKGGYRYPEQEYKMKITKATLDKNQNTGNRQLVLDLEIVEPAKYAGKPFRDYLTLTEKAMFRVGWLLDACGIRWKQAIEEIPLKKFVGKIIGVQLYDDDYGKTVKSKVAEYYTEEEVDEFLNEDADEDEDEDEDEDDDDTEDEDDDEDEDEEEEDLNDLTDKQLKARAKAAGVKGYAKMKKAKLVKAIVAAEDSEDDDDDDDDEDDL